MRRFSLVGRSMLRARWLSLAGMLALSIGAERASAQTDYYNLDAGRPTRVEDAVPTARHELEIQLAPLRVERFARGVSRWRLEPKLSFGVLPLTEIEIRAPVMHVRPSGNTSTSTGIASMGIGATHALNLETSYLPGVAVSGELLLPVGSLAATRSSYAVKALASKSFSMARFHLNASAGTYALRQPRPVPLPPGCGTAGADPCPDPPPPPPPDLPCDLIPLVQPSASLAETSASRCGGGSIGVASVTRAVRNPTRTQGKRWMVGFGVDHAFPLHSTVVAADIVAERLVGLYGITDWTAELGIRRQLWAQVVLDLGVGRHFAGALQSTSLTAGFSYGVPLRFLMRDAGSGE
jgi:hypothetical protein